MTEDRYNQIVGYSFDLEQELDENPDFLESGEYVLELVLELLDEIDRLKGGKGV